MYSLNIKQKKIIVIVGIIVLVLIIIYFYNSRLETPQLEDDILVEENQTNSNLGNKTDEKDLIIIHITGAVKIPGIVKLEEGARIEDAINKAGGLTEDADISRVNLAYVLEDGVKIKIHSTKQFTILNNEIRCKLVFLSIKIIKYFFRHAKTSFN